MRVRGWMMIGGLLLAMGCTSTGAKQPQQIEAHPEEFTSPPAGYERPPEYHIGDRPLLTKPGGPGALNTNPGAMGNQSPSPSPNFNPGMRR